MTSYVAAIYAIWPGYKDHGNREYNAASFADKIHMSESDSFGGSENGLQLVHLWYKYV